MQHTWTAAFHSDGRNLTVCRNLALLEAAGARLVRFSPMEQPLPSGISGLYLGGGYPERHSRSLAANRGLKAAIAAFAQAGGVVYAECGGLMYLSQSLQPLDNLPAAMGANGTWPPFFKKNPPFLEAFS